jgi:hypothetical protein
MKVPLFLSLLLLSLSLSAQQTIRQVIGSVGGTHTANGTTLSFTVGETQIGSHAANSHSLLKGYQQPIQLITPQRLGQLPMPSPQSFLLSELYPNPANDRAFLHYQAEGANLSVIDTKGKLLLSQKLEQKEGILSLPVQQWAEGMYIVTLNDGKTQKIHKLIISK